MRCFVAVEVPDELRAAAVRLQEALRGAGPGVRWVAPSGLHVTLKFLGELDEAVAGRLRPLLAEAARGVEPVRISIAGTGVFPERGDPRVAWAGVDGDLAPMAAAAERAAEAVGIPREGRPYVPHLTLGYVKGARGPGDLRRRLAEHGGERLGKMEVRSWTLFRSTLRPGGPVYEVLERFPIGG